MFFREVLLKLFFDILAYILSTISNLYTTLISSSCVLGYRVIYNALI